MRIAFYMTGGYAKILRRSVDYLSDIEVTAIAPNWQSYAESAKEPGFSAIDYLYSDFNSQFDQVDVAQFCEKYSSINISEVLFVDKSHFKKKPGDYQLRYACTVGVRLAEIYQRTRPDYLFIPIIEMIDAMMAYRMAIHFGIRPIIYAHARFAGLSYFSDSHLELLPHYMESQEKFAEDEKWGREFLESYKQTPGSFMGAPEFPESDVYEDFEQDTTAFQRLVKNIQLRMGIERHNQMISLWINFQVHFQKIFVPVRNLIFSLVEKFRIRPKPIPEGKYDFFPLHCSPEASINVPAPYFIDQLRVVDKILLERGANRPLVLKEHPAMFGFREKGFYAMLKRRPFISIVHRKTSSQRLIRGAHTVYSVTGTACLEAFFLGINWVQYGVNYLSDWQRRRNCAGKSSTPLDFIRDVCSVSATFILYSPGRSLHHDRILFAKRNVQNLCTHLKLHIQRDSQGKNSPKQLEI